MTRRLGLRAGDWVVVKSRDEILATLDAHARLDGLPFQPEMFAWCGRRMRVARSAHKTCDTIRKTGGRRMHDAVHLEGSRCDGAAHGGCQADCVFYWKEAWLRRADAPLPLQPRSGVCSEEAVLRATRAPVMNGSAEPAWVCQTTALYEATTPLPWWDIRQYIRDVTSGNHSARYMARILFAAAYRRSLQFGRGYSARIAFYNWVQRKRGGRPFPQVKGRIPAGQSTPARTLDLQPGEWVAVKSAEEIGETLTTEGVNRGMRFDIEMLQYTGGSYRVQMRVERLINEQTGRMMQMKTPCIQLEDVYCKGSCTSRRLGCPRATNIYWREIWLERQAAPAGGERQQHGQDSVEV